MYITIYQINQDRDSQRIKFTGYDKTLELTNQENIDASIYDEVFRGDITADSLEDIYARFNTTSHPLFRGHSLSVSDIISTDEGAFYCDNYGFKEIDFDSTLTHKDENLKTIVYVEPNRKPFISDIEGSLEAEQKAVGGYIEPIYNDDDTCLVGNEEAKLMGMEGNRHIGRSGTSIIAGPFFVIGLSEDNFRSLTDEEANKYMEVFKEPELISQEEVQDDMKFMFYYF